MARVTTTETTAADQAWEEYFAIQLTPEQKEAGRAELEKRVEQARRDGVYERLAALKGKIQWSMTWQELRDKDE